MKNHAYRCPQPAPICLRRAWPFARPCTLTSACTPTSKVNLEVHMRHLLLLSVLLLSASWAAAQNYPSQTNPSQTSSSQTAPSTAGVQTTIQGCLSGSKGNYTLTDKKGNTYELAGDASKLEEHVGHEMRVTGTAASAAPSGKAAGSRTEETSNSSQQAFEVSSVKHVSKTCQSGGTSR